MSACVGKYVCTYYLHARSTSIMAITAHLTITATDRKLSTIWPLSRCVKMNPCLAILSSFYQNFVPFLLHWQLNITSALKIKLTLSLNPVCLWWCSLLRVETLQIGVVDQNNVGYLASWHQSKSALRHLKKKTCKTYPKASKHRLLSFYTNITAIPSGAAQHLQWGGAHHPGYP